MENTAETTLLKARLDLIEECLNLLTQILADQVKTALPDHEAGLPSGCATRYWLDNYDPEQSVRRLLDNPLPVACGSTFGVTDEVMRSTRPSKPKPGN